MLDRARAGGRFQSALRECFLRHRGEKVEAYLREVTRCLAAYIDAGRVIMSG